MTDQVGKPRPPSFTKGENALAGVPSRVEGSRLWIHTESAASGCFVWAGIIFSLVPFWVGLSMRQSEPRWIWVGLAMSLVALVTVLFSSLYRWDEYAIADREARTFQTVRIARFGSTYGPVEAVPKGGRLVLVRLLQAKKEYYSHAKVAPGETQYTWFGPVQLNLRWHELLVVSDGGAPIKVLSDAAQPASHVDLFRIAGKGLSEFMALPFSDYSRELTEFEESLPREHALIEYIALPEEMRHFDTREPICAGYDLPFPSDRRTRVS
jgi:hypothetical protein